MISVPYCLIGFAFFFAMIMTSLSCKEMEVTEFKETLDSELLQKYREIVNMRFRIWIEGLVLGLVVGVLFAYFLGSKTNRLGRACMLTAIMLFVNYMYYIMYPKPVYMLTELKNMKQVKEWNDVYKLMQFKYHLGLLFGIVAYFMISMGIME